jgi:hypothetical protein
MAKLGLVGFAAPSPSRARRTTCCVNTIAPIAGSRMTETVLPKELLDALKPEYVSAAGGLALPRGCDETGGLFEVGGGFFGKLRWERTEGHLFRLGRPSPPRTSRSAGARSPTSRSATHPPNITALDAAHHGQRQGRPEQGRQRVHRRRPGARLRVPRVKTSRYDERDLALYALGVGAGQTPRRRRPRSSTSSTARASTPCRPTASCPRSTPSSSWQARARPRRASTTASTACSTASSTPRCCARCRRRRSSAHRPGQGHLRQGQERVVVMEIETYDETGEVLWPTTSSAPSCAAPAAGAAIAARERRERPPTARPTASTEKTATTRRCSTASRATGTRCTPTRLRQAPSASRSRSCTACAPSATPCATW